MDVVTAAVVSAKNDDEIELGYDEVFDSLLKIFVESPVYPKSKTSHEWKRYVKIRDIITAEHLSKMQEFYKLPKSEEYDKTWNRKNSLVTLLNQWSEQLDFAYSHCNNKPTSFINFV